MNQLLAEGLSIDAIAGRVRRSPSTVSYWLKRHALEANGAEKYGPKPPLAVESVVALIDEGFSVPEMARRLDCTPSQLRTWLRRNGLKSRQAQNRDASRTALARGERSTELRCTHHGVVVHVLENRGSYRCTRCRAERVAEHRRRIKRVLIAEAGGACLLCGYNRCEAALQFHHLDPAQKAFHLSLRGVTRSLEMIRAEAESAYCSAPPATLKWRPATRRSRRRRTPRGGFEPP